MKKIRFAQLNAGTVTLFVIFTTLCLTMLGLLSIATSNAERKLTEKMVDSVNRYYETDSKCQEIISKIDSNLFNRYNENLGVKLDKKERINIIKDCIEDVKDTEFNISEDENGINVSFSVPNGQISTLNVKLFVPCEEAEKLRYKILEYRIVPNEQTGYEESNLNLWDGTIPE